MVFNTLCLLSAVLFQSVLSFRTSEVIVRADCPKACDIHNNTCDAHTAPTCIYPDPRLSNPRGACACRPGFKATGYVDIDTSRQWRQPVLGGEHRVWVAEGVKCDTLCVIWSGVNSCQEVSLIPEACGVLGHDMANQTDHPSPPPVINGTEGLRNTTMPDPYVNTTHGKSPNTTNDDYLNQSHGAYNDHPNNPPAKMNPSISFETNSNTPDELDTPTDSGIEHVARSVTPIHPAAVYARRGAHILSRRQNETTSPGYGLPATNDDILGVTEQHLTNGTNLLGPIDYTADMNIYTSQPYAKNALCAIPLTDQHTLGGDSSAMDLGTTFYPKTGDLDDRYVLQGNIGNCAFGAAVLSFLKVGMLQNLLNRMSPTILVKHPTGQYFWANFIQNGNSKSKQIVLIDDRLARGKDTEVWPCKDYLSFKPFEGSYFIPLLEKAFAKFVDNYPEEFRSSSVRAHDGLAEVYGINGLRGISGAKVIQALRGGMNKTVIRNYAGEGGPTTADIQAALVNCIVKNIPCTSGTPSLYDRSHNNSQFFWGLLNQVDLPGGGGGKSVNLVDGWVVRNMPTIQEGILFELVNTALGKRYALVGNHAYSVSAGQGVGTVALGNPWGYQPDGPDGYPIKGASWMPFIEIPIVVAASFLGRVEWTE